MKSPKQFIEILKIAKEDKAESIQIPYRMKNGQLAEEDKEFFHLLSNLSDDDPLKVIEYTEDKMILEIYYPGICNLVEAFDKQYKPKAKKSKNKKKGNKK